MFLLIQALHLQSTYDLVSCQFALHYAWDTEERARRVLQNASSRLAVGGYILLTFPDKRRIMDQLARLRDSTDAYNYTADEYTYRIGGPRHHLTFESDLPIDEFIDSLNHTPYGHAYTYFQEGSILDVPEYLVDPAALADMCEALGLRVEQNWNFLAFQDDHTPLRRAMGADRPLDAECAQIAELYRAVVLTKRKRSRDE